MGEAADKRKTALLILPVLFYAYFVKGISQALERAGYDVEIANDEYPNIMPIRILAHLNAFGILRFFTRHAYAKHILGKRHYDLALIMKGRGMSAELIAALRNDASRVVAYNFDSFDYNPASLSWFRQVDRFSTFDYTDAERHGLPRVDLFSSLPDQTTPARRPWELSAIMKNHSNRLEFLDAVLGCFADKKVFVYIFEPNIFTAAVNFLRNPSLYWKYRRFIRGCPLPYAEYVAALKGAEFTLDYAHPKQSGATIRSFEALSAGTKVITNNAYMLKYPLFNDANTVVVATGGDRRALCRQIERLRGTQPPAHHRSVDEFVADVLAEG